MTQDVRYAWRLIVRHPRVSALVVTTLAIGMAATTVVFSLADAILWHPLPFRDADRLVRVRIGVTAAHAASARPLDVLRPDFGASVFDALHPFQLNSGIASVGGEPRAVTIGEISPGLLQALGAAPIRGRDLASEDFVAGSTAVLVSAELWRTQQSAAGSPDAAALVIDGVRHTIVGVMPDGFEFPVSRVALWRPWRADRTGARLTALGRLKPGVTMGQAEAFATATRARPGAPFSEIRVMPFVIVVPATVTALRLLLGAVALLLAVAVANAANIIQAEMIRRDTEIAVRASLGASWLRLVRPFVAESLLLSAIAAIVALVATSWTLTALVRGVPYLMAFQSLRPIAVDWRAFLFAAIVAIVAGIGTSWLSALRARRIDPPLALRGQSAGLAGQARARSALTAAQIAIALVLLSAAGLLGNGFARLSRVDPGFDPTQLVAVDVQLPTWQYATDRQLRAALETLRATVKRLPGAVDVTVSHSTPPSLESRPLTGLMTDETPLTSTEGVVSIGLVDDRFFATLGIPLLSGRAFDDRDDERGTPVAIVSRALAARLWPDRDPIGRRFRESAAAAWLTVVGIVGDVHNGGFDQAIGPLAYYTARAQSPTWWYESVIVRTRTAPDRLVPDLRAAIQRSFPDGPIVGVRVGAETVAGVNARVRFLTVLTSIFAIVALTVALVGVYGSFWCVVSQRTREIGVRMALGASASDVLRLVLGGSARVIAAGLAVGLPLALVTSRLLRSWLFEVSPSDPPTFVAVAAFLAAAAMVATYVPARRAAAADPANALRTP